MGWVQIAPVPESENKQRLTILFSTYKITHCYR